MRAITVTKDQRSALALCNVDDPTPRRSEALVRIEAISLNQGEVRVALSDADKGWVPGWDFAGVVERQAEDGTGPASGDRVVGYVEHGAWAERVAVPSNALALLPPDVETSVAATLPVAGLTALWTLAEGGLLAGQRVLVNGASGGVGHMAVQIASRSGALVTAAVRQDHQIEATRNDGAADVIVSDGLEEARRLGEFDLILESAGGEALGRAMTMLSPQGVCVCFGNSSRSPVVFEPFDFTRDRARLIGFSLLARLRRVPASTGLERLVSLVSLGVLAPRIAVEESWENIQGVVDRFMRREISGKAVLRL